MKILNDAEENKLTLKMFLEGWIKQKTVANWSKRDFLLILLIAIDDGS